MTLACFETKQTDKAIPIQFFTPDALKDWVGKQPSFVKHWIDANNFVADPDTFCLIPNHKGTLETVLYGVEPNKPAVAFAQLATLLPSHVYTLTPSPQHERCDDYLLQWALQTYQFSKYKNTKQKKFPKLLIPDSVDFVFLSQFVESVFLIRDLINTPTENLGPAELAGVVESIAKTHQAKVQQCIGDDLLKKNFPAIHTVGRASTQLPRLIDLRWGNASHKKLTLVGKGVCFDSGGLDLKPNRGLKLMKKDMGGAAHVIGLAKLIMSLKLPVQLRVLIPAVENAIAGNAYRPGDIIKTRSKKTVEIGNTDAEGRVILADALFEASQEKPDLLIDFSTLTGAARVALGTDIPVCFTNQSQLQIALEQCSQETQDPLWFLPLYLPYRNLLNSPVADINNVGDDTYGGAILAALFLNEFVSTDIPWLHIDLMAWNLRSRPGKPEGGEAMALRATLQLIQKIFINS